ncbi:hypothetical protein [Dyadobacter chenhuakuii]|uniref:Uncharacterized protein n=1 Tax=Dyadobacter chenhuakuii TaxID=2909339 RepID=A0ABY4XNA2_9BACT|nr:hypothetical protein [Dyadobacter chenhuakuii]MCF2494767.1 hypothetical protein [Dyadobacter chenhuakuii]USJ31912.1 hypothetical protein NFI80_04070 [Dyadobacter chenhuakuii]
MQAKDQAVPLLSGSKTLVVATFFMLVVLISRCSREKIEPHLDVPGSARHMIYQKYPAAEISKMKVLEPGKVYQLSFRYKGANYQSVVNNAGILNTARQADEGIPEALLAKLETLAIRGGRISNHRVVESYYAGGPDKEDVYDYHLNGKDYVLTGGAYGVILRPYQQTSYVTKSIDDLPEKIRQFINSRHKPNHAFVNSLTNLNEPSRDYIMENNELTFMECVVSIFPDGSKIYSVTVNFLGVTGLSGMRFDEDGNLISIPQFNRIRQFNTDFTTLSWISNLKTSEIKYFRDLFAAQSHLFGFNLDSQQNFGKSFKSEFENFKCYEFELYNSNRERWSMHYNEQKALVYYSYSSPQ